MLFRSLSLCLRRSMYFLLDGPEIFIFTFCLFLMSSLFFIWFLLGVWYPSPQFSFLSTYTVTHVYSMFIYGQLFECAGFIPFECGSVFLLRVLIELVLSRFSVYYLCWICSYVRAFLRQLLLFSSDFSILL